MKMKPLRHYLLAGLVVWLPILVTIWVLRFIVDLLDKSIALLPQAYHPEAWFGQAIPGFGVLFSFVILWVTGLIASNFIGQRLVGWSELLLTRIPLVRSIYNATKQVIQTLFSTDSEAFRKVLLIEYPRKGAWSLAFQTSHVSSHLTSYVGKEMLSVFIPTTPNPTSGFLIMLPREEVVEVDMSVDEAFKLIVSLGVVQHPSSTKTL
jgi:uncharacterized membrane protein